MGLPGLGQRHAIRSAKAAHAHQTARRLGGRVGSSRLSFWPPQAHIARPSPTTRSRTCSSCNFERLSVHNRADIRRPLRSPIHSCGRRPPPMQNRRAMAAAYNAIAATLERYVNGARIRRRRTRARGLARIFVFRLTDCALGCFFPPVRFLATAVSWAG